MLSDLSAVCVVGHGSHQHPWRHDMDLGVGKEMFDTNLRREHEKQRELELKKQQQQVK